MLVGHFCQEFGDPKDIPEPSCKSIKVHGLNGKYSACDFGSDSLSYFLANTILQQQWQWLAIGLMHLQEPPFQIIEGSGALDNAADIVVTVTGNRGGSTSVITITDRGDGTTDCT